MAIEDTMSQMTWALIQDWMNKRSNKYSLENMLRQQEGWNAYQERGAELNKEYTTAAANEQIRAKITEAALRLMEMKSPDLLRALPILQAIAPQVFANFGGVQAEAERGAGLINEQFGPLMQGLWDKLQAGDLAKHMGMDELMRGATQAGAPLERLRFEEPVNKLNAAANAAAAMREPGGGAAAGTGPAHTRWYALLDDAEATVSRAASIFKPNANAGDMAKIMEFMGAIPGLSEVPKEDVKNWAMELGPEFFHSLAGKLRQIRASEIKAGMTDPGHLPADEDMALIMKSADLYGLGKMFMQKRDEYLRELEMKVPENYALYRSGNQTAIDLVNEVVWNRLFRGSAYDYEEE